jgi:FtsH-binding integral membrane protein
MSRRPLSVTVAAILLALFSVLFDLSFPLWAELIPREDMVPAVVVYTSVVVGVVALVGTTGLWMLRKWGVWLTSVVCVLNILDAVGGVVGAPNAALQVASAIGVLGFALIIVLVVLPPSQRAFAAAY